MRVDRLVPVIPFRAIGSPVILDVRADTFEFKTLREPIPGLLPALGAVLIAEVLAIIGSDPLYCVQILLNVVVIFGVLLLPLSICIPLHDLLVRGDG